MSAPLPIRTVDGPVYRLYRSSESCRCKRAAGYAPVSVRGWSEPRICHQLFKEKGHDELAEVILQSSVNRAVSACDSSTSATDSQRLPSRTDQSGFYRDGDGVPTAKDPVLFSLKRKKQVFHIAPWQCQAVMTVKPILQQLKALGT